MALSDKEEAQIRVETARRALDDDLATLTDRLPAAAMIGQAGAAGGVGLAVLGAAAKQLQKKLSQRSDEKALTREAEIQAKAIAAAIAAAGLGGAPAAPATQAAEVAPTPKPAPKPSRPARAVAAVDAMTPDADDDGGTPWGIILLLAALVAAVVAVVVGANDDDDLWTTPGA